MCLCHLSLVVTNPRTSDMALTKIERARFRRDHAYHYCAWLIDAEGKNRKFYALSSDEAYALAKAAGDRAIERLRRQGFSAQDRFHVACEGVQYNISLNA